LISHLLSLTSTYAQATSQLLLSDQQGSLSTGFICNLRLPALKPVLFLQIPFSGGGCKVDNSQSNVYDHIKDLNHGACPLGGRA
jgi:hypothetical protein